MAAKLVERAEDYRWSSARSHVAGERAEDDPLTEMAALAESVTNWKTMLRHGLEAGATEEGEAIAEIIETRLRTVRPLAAEEWIGREEVRVSRHLHTR